MKHDRTGTVVLLMDMHLYSSMRVSFDDDRIPNTVSFYMNTEEVTKERVALGDRVTLSWEPVRTTESVLDPVELKEEPPLPLVAGYDVQSTEVETSRVARVAAFLLLIAGIELLTIGILTYLLLAR